MVWWHSQFSLLHICCATTVNIMIYLLFLTELSLRHKKLITKLKERHSWGESSLIIQNGTVVVRPPCYGNLSSTQGTRPSYSVVLHDVSFIQISISSLSVLYTNADQLLNKSNDLEMFIAGNEPNLMLISEFLPKNHLVFGLWEYKNNDP